MIAAQGIYTRILKLKIPAHVLKLTVATDNDRSLTPLKQKTWKTIPRPKTKCETNASSPTHHKKKGKGKDLEQNPLPRVGGGKGGAHEGTPNKIRT